MRDKVKGFGAAVAMLPVIAILFCIFYVMPWYAVFIALGLAGAIISFVWGFSYLFLD